jgi:hypothetical protein
LCEGDYNPEVEIILGFNPDPQGPTWRGKKPGEVTPFGMSGGGVWRFPSLGSAGSWKPSDIRVVGLQSVWNETKKFLRVTRIARLLRLIADEDTDLSKLIQQHLSRE